ncbi:hypothetical protein [Hyphobacterium sp.]|uniref:hypothetical protein n=1 Tax=Hyphobacterium sp. TaxID=2004662 RepID=UPI003749715C
MLRIAVIPALLITVAACSPRDDSALHAQIAESIGNEPPYSAVGIIRCLGNDAEAECMGCVLTAYDPGDLDNRVFAEIQQYNFRTDGEAGMDLVSFGGAHGIERIQHDGTPAGVAEALRAGREWCDGQGVTDWYVENDTVAETYEGGAR